MSRGRVLTRKMRAIRGSAGPSTFFGQLATRTYVPNTLLDTNTYAVRTFRYARSGITSLKVAIPGGWYVPGNAAETNSGGTTSIRASIEYPAGTFFQLKFSGSALGSFASGAMGWSDLLTGLSIPAGAMFFVRMSISNTSGIAYYLTANGNRTFVSSTTYDAMEQTATDLTMSGTITDGFNSFANGCIWPMAIVGPTTSASLALLGDSRQTGEGDFTTDTTGDVGELPRLFGGTYAYLKCAIAGDTAQEFVSSHANRIALAQYCTHVACNYGGNDLNGGTSAATIEGYLATIQGLIGQRPFSQTTVSPITTSTDNWATTGNQSFSSTFNTQRQTLNTFVRGGGAGTLIDVSSVEEFSGTSGVWNAPNYTGDGLHESTFGNTQIAAVLGVPGLTVPNNAASWMPSS
jgi:hypothetical protein